MKCEVAKVQRCYGSAVGSKILVAVTGLGLAGFVLGHMAGNLLIMVDPRLFNLYGHAIVSNPLVYVAEAGLILFFSLHVLKAVQVTIRNFKARPQGYSRASSGAKGTSLAAKSMWFQGTLILVFVVYHVITFKYGAHYTISYDGQTVRDLHRLVVEVFHQPTYVAWYVFCLVLLGLHLSHGVSSVFQSLGFHHPRYTPIIKVSGWVYALVVSGGFIAQPLYVYFFY